MEAIPIEVQAIIFRMIPVKKYSRIACVCKLFAFAIRYIVNYAKSKGLFASIVDKDVVSAKIVSMNSIRVIRRFNFAPRLISNIELLCNGKGVVCDSTRISKKIREIRDYEIIATIFVTQTVIITCEQFILLSFDKSLLIPNIQKAIDIGIMNHQNKNIICHHLSTLLDTEFNRGDANAA